MEQDENNALIETNLFLHINIKKTTTACIIVFVPEKKPS